MGKPGYNIFLLLPLFYLPSGFQVGLERVRGQRVLIVAHAFLQPQPGLTRQSIEALPVNITG